MNSTPDNFMHLGLAPKILGILAQNKIETPTPIQTKAIPVILEGKDLVGIAQTGTGKTFAFGLPMIQRLVAQGGRGLVLLPTRELAMQVDEALIKYARAEGLRTVVLIGGMSMNRQIQELHRRPRIIIATPGRLIDHLEQRTVHLNDANFVVLDEADRMFDMGFQPQIERILRQVPKKRQTLLFSATMPPGIVKLATGHMELPLTIEIAPQGTSAEKVQQEMFIVSEEDKRKLLGILLNQYRGSVLIFARTKIRARRICRTIESLGHNVAEIHSDRSMAQRKQAIEGFKAGRYRILVATDIAARGIDVKMIEMVINYDLPEDIETYVHRIGRTGRAGMEGYAVSFAMPDQRADVLGIERLMKRTIPIVEHPELPKKEFVKPVYQGFRFPKSRRRKPPSRVRHGRRR